MHILHFLARHELAASAALIVGATIASGSAAHSGFPSGLPNINIRIDTAQSKPASSPALDAEADQLFKDVPALLARRLEVLGQPRANIWPSKEAIDREAALYEKRKTANAIIPFSNRDRMLCYNLLIHRPEVGRAYFNIQADAGDMDAVKLGAFINPALIAAGEWGEERALQGEKDPVVERRRVWAMYLGSFATYTKSRAPIEKWITNEKDDEAAAFLLKALANIADRDSLPFVRKVFETTKSDERRAGALFALVEFLGTDIIPEMDKMKPEGTHTLQELAEAMKYLKEEAKGGGNKHGFVIANDSEFLMRFADLYSNPTIAWLKRKGRLEDAAVAKEEPLSPTDKAELFSSLEDGFVFGLPAIKGSLFKSIKQEDLPELLKLRSLAHYKPSSFSEGHVKTINIMIRSLRMP
ncbi:MAG: hypothetical protein HY286_01685 [Planctomycetes bacterium]|nr:hypothetical protein [Planctomycetota bacterium]